MKKLLLGLACGLGLLVAACDPVTTQQAVDTTTKAVATVKAVQTYTQQVCKFVPTAATITSIFSATIGGSIASIGGAICDAVTTNPLAEGDKPGFYEPAKVNGVVIKGKFVR
jgi:ABC-type enterobactin transport system permease subunit